ncbi:MAG TPA: TonB family protein [Chthoniobacterales bacterium]|nr:TonB family protein [Chthoniobacterales bacterium]
MKAFVSSVVAIALGAAHVSAADPSPTPSAATKKKSQTQTADPAQTDAAAAAVTGKRVPGLPRVETQSPAKLNAEQTAKGQAKKNVISGGVLDRKAISKPQPRYPDAAKGSGASGKVEVQVVVDEKGRVESAKAISGHRLLREAATQAARKARFTPTLLSGQPVKVTGVITYNFVLQ